MGLTILDKAFMCEFLFGIHISFRHIIFLVKEEIVLLGRLFYTYFLLIQNNDIFFLFFFVLNKRLHIIKSTIPPERITTEVLPISFKT